MKSLFENAFENAPIGMALVSKEGNWLKVNKSLCTIVGYSETELLAINFQKITHPDDLDKDLSLLHEILDGKRETYKLEKRYIHKNKEIIWIQLSVSLVRDANNEPAYFISQIEDITENKKISDQLKKAIEVKSRFLANMSHEIRTPLNGIIGLASLSLDEKLTEEVKGNLEHIRSSSECLLNILNDVLDLSKLEANKTVFKKEDFELENLVKTSLAIFYPLAKSKGLLLDYEVDMNISMFCRGDETRIKQLIYNLVGNALKFTNHGYVKLKVDLERRSENGQYIVMSIEDTGIGIEKENITKILTPFEQVDSSNAREFGGTGLGLAICEKIVNAMEGKISIDSVVGKGTTIKAFFQLENGKKVITKENKSTSNVDLDVDADINKVLVAEDNAVNRLVVKKQLKKLGINEIDFAVNGKEAVKMALCDRYSLILMDIQMPEMDGYEATQIIKDKAPYQATIIGFSANVFNDDKQKGFSVGMDGFLEKPVDLDSLAEVLSVNKRNRLGFTPAVK